VIILESTSCDITKLPIKAEELKKDVTVKGTKNLIPLNKIASGVVRNYFEYRLREDKIKTAYIKCLKDNENYKKTQTYNQAKSLFAKDEVKFKKDVLYENTLMIILGLEDVLAKFSLDEIDNYSKAFDITQNQLRLGTIFFLLSLVVR